MNFVLQLLISTTEVFGLVLLATTCFALIASDAIKDKYRKKPMAGHHQQDDEAVKDCTRDIKKLPAQGMSSPVARLENLGASLFDDQSMTWEELGGYEAMKSELQRSVITPLKHNGVFNDIARKTRRKFESNWTRAILFHGK